MPKGYQSRSLLGVSLPDTPVTRLVETQALTMEAGVTAWVWVIVCNTAELSLAGWIMSYIGSKTTRVALCYLCMWMKHAPLPIDGDQGVVAWSPHRPRSWLFALLLHSVVAVCLLLLLEEPPIYLVMAKVASAGARYLWHLRFGMERFQRGRFPWLLWGQLVSVSVCAYGMALSVYGLNRAYPLEAGRFDSAQPEPDSVYQGRFLAFGVLYPVARQLCKYLLGTCLLGEAAENEGVRRRRALYLEVAFDLPSYVLVYSQETTELTTALVASHCALDVAFTAFKWWDTPRRNHHHALWLQLLAISMVVVIWPPLLENQPETLAYRTVHSLMLVERVFIALTYSLCLWMGAPAAHAALWSDKGEPPFSPTLKKDTTEDIHYNSNLVDSICYALWAVAIATSKA